MAGFLRGRLGPLFLFFPALRQRFLLVTLYFIHIALNLISQNDYTLTQLNCRSCLIDWRIDCILLAIQQLKFLGEADKVCFIRLLDVVLQNAKTQFVLLANRLIILPLVLFVRVSLFLLLLGSLNGLEHSAGGDKADRFWLEESEYTKTVEPHAS